jgi:hypothetical protein
MSNPLYRDYTPGGYVKSDEELVSDCILRIGDEFNGWLGSLEGTPISISPSILIQILRHGMETD